MRHINILRLNVSPYQRSDFTEIEKTLLEGLPGVQYTCPKGLGPEADVVLITNTHTVLRDLEPDLLKRTKLIIHPNSGYDHFEKDQMLWQNIPLVIGHVIRAQAVAEYTLGCLFEGLLEIPQHLSWCKNRKWNRALMKGLPVAVFGHGHIGKIVAATLNQLGMKVSVIDPFVPGFAKSWKEIDLKSTRVVLSCMSLNSTSQKIFNEDFFNHAHDELLFINGARGGLVDEKALKGFLLSHPRAFAFLDVFDKEPFTEEWHHFPQVWKTSHIAGVHQDLDQGILDFEYQTLKDFLNLPDKDFKMKYQQEILQNKWIQGELV